MTAHGSYDTIDGRPAVRFERRLAQPVDRVWSAVTEPSELAHWFPDAPPSDDAVGACEPKRLFEFTWGPSDTVRIELEPDGDGCLLRLTHLLGGADQAARDAAGWHVCLRRLETHLGGGEARAPGSEPTAEWRELYDDYAGRGLPTGAPVPETRVNVPEPGL
jgi:uncharacterized protein YndB with AHSA1/START domain